METKKIKYLVLDHDEKTKRVFTYEETVEYPEDHRHHNMCYACGNPTYPKCRYTCRNDRILREREARTGRG